VTTVKIASKLGAAAEAALEPHVPRLYARSGMRMLAVAELKHDDKNVPAADSDASAWVKCKITHLEVPGPDQEGAVREAMRVLYLQRTAAGTLTEDGELELDEGTLNLTAGLLTEIETARLTAALRHWAAYARRVVAADDLTLSEIRHELHTVADGLTAALGGGRLGDGDL